jgi:hypothetical protein
MKPVAKVADNSNMRRVSVIDSNHKKGRFMLDLRSHQRLGLTSRRLLAAVGISLLLVSRAPAADDSSPPASGSTMERSSSHQAAAPTADQDNKPRIEGGQVNGRWREGSRLIDQVGSFRVTGDHVTFTSSDGKLKFEGLENLAIERIARTIGDSPDQLEWTISGIITEYRGANYLLVTQAVLKTKATRPRR